MPAPRRAWGCPVKGRPLSGPTKQQQGVCPAAQRSPSTTRANPRGPHQAPFHAPQSLAQGEAEGMGSCHSLSSRVQSGAGSAVGGAARPCAELPAPHAVGAVLSPGESRGSSPPLLHSHFRPELRPRGCLALPAPLRSDPPSRSLCCELAPRPRLPSPPPTPSTTLPTVLLVHSPSPAPPPCLAVLPTPHTSVRLSSAPTGCPSSGL